MADKSPCRGCEREKLSKLNGECCECSKPNNWDAARAQFYAGTSSSLMSGLLGGSGLTGLRRVPHGIVGS